MTRYFVRAQRALDNAHGCLFVEDTDPNAAEAKALEILRDPQAQAKAGLVWCEVQHPQDMMEGEDFFIMDVLAAPTADAEQALAAVQAVAPDVPVLTQAQVKEIQAAVAGTEEK